MNKAKAAILTEANKPFEIREYELTAPPAGFAKTELIASGICGTDIHIHSGRLGSTPNRIIGHEFVGKISEIAEADSEKYGLKAGDNVIVDIAVPCGECELCKNGDDANCVNMQITSGFDPDIAPHFYGGYAEFNYTQAQNLVKIPESVNPKAAAVFACPGPTAIHAFSLSKKAGYDVKNAKTAVVQGAGPVGTFAIAYLASLNIKNVVVITSSRDEAKEKLVMSMGATEMLYLSDGVENIEKRIAELTDSLGADLVFEASGNPNAIPVGMNILRNRGVYLIPGQYSDSGAVPIHPEIITFKALHIIGSSQYSMCDVRDYVDFLSDKPELQEKIFALATCYKVEDINKAIEDIHARKNIKTLLVK